MTTDMMVEGYILNVDESRGTLATRSGVVLARLERRDNSWWAIMTPAIGGLPPSGEVNHEPFGPSEDAAGAARAMLAWRGE